MKKIKGPGIFLAQFLEDSKPFNDLNAICAWAASLGYLGVQIPTWDERIFDLKKAAESKTYCDEINGIVGAHGLSITELSTHLQGQLVAVNPAYDLLFDGFTPESLRGNPRARTEWAVQQLKWAGTASKLLGLSAHATFSGSLLWHTIYPWPPRPAGLVKEGFKELSRRWLPILNHFQEQGIDLCYELHPGEDLHDGVSYERFLKETGNHQTVNILYDPSHFLLQQLDYISFIDFYHQDIKMFHVKDAEFNPSGKQGVYGGYEEWENRAGRFRSLGDGQIDFNTIFSKLTQFDFNGWAVMEWECCIKSSEQGAQEGARFIKDHIINVSSKKFDDFAGGTSEKETINKILGI